MSKNSYSFVVIVEEEWDVEVEAESEEAAEDLIRTHYLYRDTLAASYNCRLDTTDITFRS